MEATEHENNTSYRATRGCTLCRAENNTELLDEKRSQRKRISGGPTLAPADLRNLAKGTLEILLACRSRRIQEKGPISAVRAHLPINEGVRRGRHRRRLLCGVRDVLVVGHVFVILHLRLVRRGDFLRLHLLQVQALEPAVAEDVVGASLQVTVALGEIRGYKLLHQGLGVLVEILGEVDLAGEDL